MVPSSRCGAFAQRSGAKGQLLCLARVIIARVGTCSPLRRRRSPGARAASIEPPFYEPQKYDYFASYILMAVTDVFALLILWRIVQMEKRGKIERLGAMEDEQAQQQTKKA